MIVWNKGNILESNEIKGEKLENRKNKEREHLRKEEKNEKHRWELGRELGCIITLETKGEESYKAGWSPV